MARTTPVNAGYQIINGESKGINAEYVDCWLEWKLLEQDIQANTSRIHVLLYAQATIEVSTAWTVAEKFGYVGYDDGSRQYHSTAYDFTGKKINCFGDYIFTVHHGSNGTKTVKLQGMWATTHSQYIAGGSAAGAVALPQIPRQSTVKATDANIGAVSMISVLRHDPNYTHAVAWNFGGQSGYLTATGEVTDREQRFGAASIPFTVPESFYLLIPDAPSGVCTLTCRTYAGQTQVGEDSICTCRLTADPLLCGPQVSGTVEDINDGTLLLTGDPQVLVRYMSVARCRIAAIPQKGANVTRLQIAGQQLSPQEDVVVLTDVQSPYITFGATDSRGYSASFTPEDMTMVDYIRLTCNATVSRTDPTSGDAVLEGKGSWFAGSFGVRNNSLTISCSIDDGDWLDLTPEMTEEGYRFHALLTGLDYRQRHRVLVRVQDALDEMILTLSVGKGIPVFDWDESDFAFHVPVSAPGMQLGGIYMSDTDVSPGADWQRIDPTGLYLWKRTQ